MKKLTLTTAAAAAILCLNSLTAFAADTTKHGYGQGTAVDNLNRPTGAIEFNSQYSGIDAYALSEAENRIILTFDQGYENGYTDDILDVLKEKNVTANFFLTGDYARKEKDLVNRMIAEGHVLGNHGMKHASLPTLTEVEAEEEIMSLHQFVLDEYIRKSHLSICRNSVIKHCSGATLMWTGKLTVSRQPAKALKSSQNQLMEEKYYCFTPYLRQMLRF